MLACGNREERVSHAALSYFDLRLGESMVKFVMWLGLSLLLSMSFFQAPALAEADKRTVQIELNSLQPHDGSCRAHLVLENRTQTAFETLKLDLVMFDLDGVVARRVAVETAPLPADKTRLKVFDIDGLACEDIGRVLLNDVMTCADSSGERHDCLAFTATSARGAVQFIK